MYMIDNAGNPLTQTDVRGITTSYSYDALNRVTTIDYPGTDRDIAYFYDGSNYSAPIVNGVGRLTGTQTATETTELQYDARGNVTSKSQVLGGATLTTS